LCAKKTTTTKKLGRNMILKNIHSEGLGYDFLPLPALSHGHLNSFVLFFPLEEHYIG